MKSRFLVFTAVAFLAILVACRQESTTTETQASVTESSATTATVSTGSTETTMTTMTTATETTGTTTVTPPAISTAGVQQIKEGAKELGRGLKEEARQATAAAGAAMQRGGEKLQEKAEQAAPQPSAPPAAAASTANVAGGASIFKAKCVACHGADASSNTAMGKKNNIPDLRSAAVQGMSDAQLSNLIANGKPGGLSASAHKSKALSQDQIKDVIAFLRSIRQ